MTKKEENAPVLDGIPVIGLSAFAGGLSQAEKDKIEILIATPENVMGEIEADLERHGFYYHARMTSFRWAQLMGYYYVRNGNYMPLSALPVGYHKAGIHVFMAKFYKDRPLREGCRMPSWVTPIQVGAALCKERIADVLDCDGENISAKNMNYSELTALYWIWKNRLSGQGGAGGREYFGLFHYRRILDLSEDDLLRLTDNGVDVVLPYPMPYEPNIHAHHERYLKRADWDALLKAIGELQPEYAGAVPEVLEQQYLYNYNIILAEKAVLREYCEWLFPILERTEELSEPKGCERNDRYIGYMGETLETIYFMKNADRLNRAHAGCRMLV